MRPLIAVTTTSRPGGAYGLPQATLDTLYISAVEQTGGVAILVSPAHDAASIDQILDVVQGVLLTGGEDVHPSRYGQEAHPALGMVNPARDAMELAVLERALERKMPVLAICRGCQLLNVALGGTLYQDLPSQRPGGTLHEQSAPVTHRSHGATVDAGSSLHEIFGTDSLFINSFHHQGIDRLAPDLRVTVRAEDGLPEGVESQTHRWVHGVQWHPERGEANAPRDRRDPDRRLFWSFVRAAEAWGGLNRPELRLHA